jgi:hypothetical protein
MNIHDEPYAYVSFNDNKKDVGVQASTPPESKNPSPTKKFVKSRSVHLLPTPEQSAKSETKRERIFVDLIEKSNPSKLNLINKYSSTQRAKSPFLENEPYIITQSSMERSDESFGRSQSKNEAVQQVSQTMTV